MLPELAQSQSCSLEIAIGWRRGTNSLARLNLPSKPVYSIRHCAVTQSPEDEEKHQKSTFTRPGVMRLEQRTRLVSQSAFRAILLRFGESVVAIL